MQRAAKGSPYIGLNKFIWESKDGQWPSLHQFKQIYSGIKGRPMAVPTNQMNGLTPEFAPMALFFIQRLLHHCQTT